MLFLIIFLIIVLNNNALAQAAEEHYLDRDRDNDNSYYNYCMEERCSEHGPPIRFPFRLLNDKYSGSEQQQSNDFFCGYSGFDLTCIGNKTALYFELFPFTKSLSRNLFVSNIDYKSQKIGVYLGDDQHTRCLQRLLILSSYLNPSLPFQTVYNIHGKRSSYTLLKCDGEISGCDMFLVPSGSKIEEYSLTSVTFCAKIRDIYTFPDELYALYTKEYNAKSPHPLLVWSKPDCRSCEVQGKECKRKIFISETEGDDDQTECISKPKKGISKILPLMSTTFKILGSSVFLVLVVAAIHCFHTSYKSDKEIQSRIEKFLEDYTALRPSRYSYADIKKITNQFKEKLGQGAYGTVFKGKLSNDVFVAVKILNQSKGGGEEFINEVSTIGQIHHVNVVRLVGYCAEGFRRALVYELLQNDSLEKYISFEGSSGNRLLRWNTLEGIALGIARGIEYLHQGCDKRILHFDIKPNNILLDNNFKPKISDFGLAKLCSKDQSIVSMTGARGTIGYIAPEVFSKNFGNVSYKSDVYSFGMLLLEMVSGRKSTDAIEENLDKIYYPEWIYNLLEEGEDLRLEIEEDEDARIAKKLAIVGLWCIQWYPISRPTMKVVVQMLEGAGSELTMPPNPFASTSPISETNTMTHARHMTPQLEAIAE